MKKTLLLISFLLFCTPPLPQEDNSFYSECDAPYGYACEDINVLKSFIEINSQIFRHYMDYNKNGLLEPLEFGSQVWDEGRLIQLDLNYSPNIIMKKDNPTELDPINYRISELPQNIGELNKLQSLSIHNNRLSYLPNSINTLSKLEVLDLGNNIFTEISQEIGDLINLRNLILSNNYLSSLPETIGNLISLEKLWLQNNILDSIPESIDNLSNLEWLFLNNNSLKQLPTGLDKLTQLSKLDIENNQISSLPNEICEIYPGEWDCEVDALGNCIGIETCTSPPKCLKSLDLGDNALCEDGIPPCIRYSFGNQQCANCDPWEFNIEGYCADSTDYQILQNFLDMNPFSKSLPGTSGIPDSAKQCINEDWWSNGRLVEISFQHKQLNSIIPDNIGDLEELKILRLTGNMLNGEIPQTIINLKKLKILKLNSNHFTGSIPYNIGSLENIDTLWLNNNALGCADYDWECDPFGKKLSCCLQCNSSDKCDSQIPLDITNLLEIQSLQLQNNKLTGSIPVNIGNLINLNYLYIDNNLISGLIPSSIGSLASLRMLHINTNKFIGQIPIELCNLYENDLGEDIFFRANFEQNNLCPGESGFPQCIPANDLGSQYCNP